MIPRLHVVTDDETLGSEGFEDRAREVMAAGGAQLALQVRGPGTSGGRIYAVTESLQEAARESGATLLVNDRIDVALALGAHGVQLGRRSLPSGVARGLLGEGPLIGLSIHTVEEGRMAHRSGADFLVAGTVFKSPSHPGMPGVGVGHLARMIGAMRLPVVAIGGITPFRVHEVMAAGAHGVAVLQGVWGDPSPADAVASFHDALARALSGAPPPVEERWTE